MYKNYIFDFYGTLVDIHTNERKAGLWKNFSNLLAMYGATYTPAELKKAYKRSVQGEIEAVPHERYTVKPEPQLLNVFKQLYLEKGIEASDDLVTFTGRAFRALSLDFIKKYDGVDELFETIRKHGGKIYLLSNAQRVFTEPEIRLVGLYDCFDDIFISSDEGCAKPDPNFFGALLKKHNLKPEESVMIGNDFLSDIQGAYDVGLDSVYMHTSVSPEIKGELHAKYVVMSGKISEVQKCLFGDESL